MYGDLELPEFYSETWRYARCMTAAPHRCVECRRAIVRGEFHRVASGKWDGRMETHRTCCHCMVLVRWLSRNGDDGNYPIGGVLDEVGEMCRDGAGLDVARAYAAALRLRWRSHTGALLPVPHRLTDRRSRWAPRPRHRDWRFTPEGWAASDRQFAALERAWPPAPGRPAAGRPLSTGR